MVLFIDTYGAFLHVKDNMFEVRVKKGEALIKKKIAPGKVNSVLLGKGTSLSSDAVSLALQYNIDVLFLEYDGMPLGRIWHGKFGSTPKIRKAQLSASISPRGYEYAIEWVSAKLENQIDFIKKLKKHRKQKSVEIDDAIVKITDNLNALQSLDPKEMESVESRIRGFEGSAGKVYFQLLGSLLPANYQFAGRSFRPASDPFNAFLNYAYGILYSAVEKALIIAGIDPYLGFLHRDDYNLKSMVFDFIEPYRIFAEESVFKLFSAKKINQNHTDKIANGYSLNKEGKNLLLSAFNSFMEVETVRYKGKNQKRINIIQYDAHSFASGLLKKKFDTKEFEKYDLLGDV